MVVEEDSMVCGRSHGNRHGRHIRQLVTKHVRYETGTIRAVWFERDDVAEALAQFICRESTICTDIERQQGLSLLTIMPEVCRHNLRLLWQAWQVELQVVVTIRVQLRRAEVADLLTFDDHRHDRIVIS